MGDVLIVLVVAFVAGGLGLAIGMLLAPRLGRLTERGDEEDPEG